MAEKNVKASADEVKATAKAAEPKQKNKKPNIFKRLGKFFKDTAGEMKKVVWTPKAELKKSLFRKICALMLKPAFNALKKQMDPEVYGGAPLLGVPGAVIITHGNSTHKGIFYAIQTGVAAARNDVTGLIAKAIADHAGDKNQA